MDFGVFETSIGIEFKNKELLKQAFIHRSYLNENRSIKLEHNERLEFLGDAVLELVITDYLYKKYPEKDEGELTAYRSSLVNSVTLATAAEKIGMNSFLLLSKGESKDTGRARQVILANTFESLVGALYIDQGYNMAAKFIAEQLFGLIEGIVENRTFIDAKSRFQEEAQEKVGATPLYKLLKENGPDHNKVFTVGVFLREEMIVMGEGKSKQEAEQDAAEKALKQKGW
ncbi:MAG: ribonuclease III [Candidatus Pacebacteria bacterium]|nr:ribonuclease III [Candidatus Paceibacterota bacterium]MBP9819047.1 ribonuclease III [Candidatus Paceibacterota bacterium]